MKSALTFRVRNRTAIEEAFLRILLLAKELRILKIGTESVDGSKIKASAAIHKSIRYDRAGELERQLKLEIDELLAKAEREDKIKDERGDEVSAELERLSDLRAKMRMAQEELEKRAREQATRERGDYEKKVRDRNDRQGKGKGRFIKEPDDRPKDADQANLTDADSRIMRKSERSEYMQGYNAQAVVDADGTMLVVASRVSQSASDANELVHDVDGINPALGAATVILADKGYAGEDPVTEHQSRQMLVLVPVKSEDAQSPRRHDFRPPAATPHAQGEKPYQKEWVKKMEAAMATDDARRLYRLRKQSVEPVFGIIKQALGFRQFLLRGLGKVELEWKLVTCAYNLKRMTKLRMAT